MENGLGRAKPESNKFVNSNLIRNSRTMAWGEPGQKLMNFQLESN